MMFRFTIRDVLWLTLVVALAIGLQLDRLHTKDAMVALQRGKDALQRERDILFQLLATTTNREKAARQEARAFETLFLSYRNGTTRTSDQ